MNYQIMPNLTAEEYGELKNDIAARGVMVPIEYDEFGNVLDGHHRVKICAELGIKDFPKVIRAGMSDIDKRIHARKLNIARRHITQEQRRDLIREQLKETPEKSDRQIAAGLGVDHKTVSAQRGISESIGEIPQCDRETADGRTYPAQRKPVSVFNPSKLEEAVLKHPAAIKQIVDGNAKSVQEVINLVPSSIPEEMRIKPHVANNSGNNEWYTPREYIEAAKKVMGGIDLDPASCKVANKTVGAESFYTVKENGLKNKWEGRVWLNPPYSSDLIHLFANKLKEHTENKDVTEAVVLVNNATETSWFNTLIEIASAVVFPKTRVKFYMPNGETGAPLQGQAVIYIGKKQRKFLDVFKVFGWGAVID